MAEHQLPKLKVAGSIPVSRSVSFVLGLGLSQSTLNAKPSTHIGRLAQRFRAPALQAGSRWFKSSTAHPLKRPQTAATAVSRAFSFWQSCQEVTSGDTIFRILAERLQAGLLIEVESSYSVLNLILELLRGEMGVAHRHLNPRVPKHLLDCMGGGPFHNE